MTLSLRNGTEPRPPMDDLTFSDTQPRYATSDQELLAEYIQSRPDFSDRAFAQIIFWIVIPAIGIIALAFAIVTGFKLLLGS